MALLILACSLYIFLIIGENLLKVFFILLFFTDLKDISLMRKVVTTCVGGKLLSGNQTVMEGTSFPLYLQLKLRLRLALFSDKSSHPATHPSRIVVNRTETHLQGYTKTD